MEYTSEDIRQLREKTGAGMMDCKKALDKSKGDIELAIEWLRKKGINTAEKKSSRSASDGLITVDVSKEKGVILEINSETDFVARNENFQKFCNDISNFCLKTEVTSVEKLLSSNLTEGQTIQELLTETISKLGENLVIKRLNIIVNQEVYFQKYIHNSINENSGKIGVLLTFKCNKHNDEINEFSKNLCMHIAASDPKAIDIQSLDKQLIEKEKAIYFEQLKDSGKPDEILQKIVDGKIKKFYEEVCLLEQFFVMDNKVKIRDSINNLNKKNNSDFEIFKYYIYKLGQHD